MASACAPYLNSKRQGDVNFAEEGGGNTILGLPRRVRFRGVLMFSLRLLAISVLVAGCSSKVEALDMRTSFVEAAAVEEPPEHPSENDDGQIDTDPTDPTEPVEETTPLPADGEVCYPGSNDDWSTCFDVVELSSTPSGYNYPAPLGGSAQYREPATYLDLDVVDPNVALAPNFVLSEIAQAYKGRYAVVQPHAIDRLQGMRDQLGPLTVNSGYRNPDYNAGIGGASSSRHMYGDAFDIDPWDVSLDRLADECADQGAGYVGVYSTHIHCDWRDDAVNETFYGSGWRAAVYAPSPRPALDATVERDGSRFWAPAEGWDEGEPLREWMALDAAGAILDEAVGDSYEPPAGTTVVEVWVGREIVRAFPL